MWGLCDIEGKIAKMENPSQINLIDCIHFYGVLPTLKIDIKNVVPWMRSALQYLGMSSSSLSFSQSVPCTWLETKIWRWWCDALYRTYLHQTFQKFSACISKERKRHTVLLFNTTLNAELLFCYFCQKSMLILWFIILCFYVLFN